MGAHHDWYVNDTVRPFVYNHGYLDADAAWRTVMAYNSECSDRGIYCSRIPYWSNPDLSYRGSPMGVQPGTSSACVANYLNHPDCDADNRLTLNNTAYTVANFRQATQPPACFTLTALAIPSSAGAVEARSRPKLQRRLCGGHGGGTNC